MNIFDFNVTPKMNQQVLRSAPEVRVIDQDGKPAGIMTSHDALRYCIDRGLDLIMFNISAFPPVCIVARGPEKF